MLLVTWLVTGNGRNWRKADEESPRFHVRQNPVDVYAKGSIAVCVCVNRGRTRRPLPCPAGRQGCGWWERQGASQAQGIPHHAQGTKLSDIQLILPTTASRRPDGSLLPAVSSISDKGEPVRASRSSRGKVDAYHFPGSRLAREWNGRTHHVSVLDGRYRESLVTKVAPPKQNWRGTAPFLQAAQLGARIACT